MEQLGGFTIQTGPVALADLAGELQGELQQRYPATEFEFNWRWDVTAVFGDARVISQSLQQLFAGLLDADVTRCRVSASSNRRAQGIELTFCLEKMSGTPT